MKLPVLAIGSFGLLTALTVVQAEPHDRQPPIIVVLPAEVTAPETDLVLRARVSDESGVAAVTLWAKGESDPSYSAFPMIPGDDGVFAVTLSAWPGRGKRVTYFVEAVDGRSNGPQRSGSPRAPFIAALESDVAPVPAAVPAAEPTSGGGNWPTLLAAGAVPGLLGLWTARRGARRTSRKRAVPPPIADVPGLPSIPQASLEALWTGEIPAERTAQTQRREVEEDVFWMHLLGPLTSLSPRKADAELRKLARRPHIHPHEGARKFDLATLRHQLRRCHETEPRELAARWSAVERKAVVAAGSSLVEALMVIAVLGISLGVSAISLQSLEAPAKRGSDLVVSSLKQARALAMSTTTAHRVHPQGVGRLVVERAATCGATATAWTHERRLDVELPNRVTLNPGNWQVCFDGRGNANVNLVITLQHPQAKTRTVEVLLGGAVRPRT